MSRKAWFLGALLPIAVLVVWLSLHDYESCEYLREHHASQYKFEHLNHDEVEAIILSQLDGLAEGETVIESYWLNDRYFSLVAYASIDEVSSADGVVGILARHLKLAEGLRSFVGRASSNKVSKEWCEFDSAVFWFLPYSGDNKIFYGETVAGGLYFYTLVKGKYWISYLSESNGQRIFLHSGAK